MLFTTALLPSLAVVDGEGTVVAVGLFRAASLTVHNE